MASTNPDPTPDDNDDEQDAIRRAVHALPPLNDDEIDRIAALLALMRERRSSPPPAG